MNIQTRNQKSYAETSGAILPVRYNATRLFFTSLFLLYFTLSFISMIGPFIAYDVKIFICSLLGLFALILSSTRIRREDVPIIKFVVLLIASFLVSSFLVGRAKGAVGVPFLFIVSGTGIAMILLRGYVYSWGGYMLFYSLAVYFLSFMLSGVSADFVFMNVSRNNISVVLLYASISLYIMLSMENKKKIDLKPAIITFIISIWAIGRSGIVSSFVLLLGLIFVKFHVKKKYIVVICLLIAFLVYAFIQSGIFIYFVNAANANVIQHATISMLREESERGAIWMNYYDNLDLFRVICGVNVAEDPWPAGEILAYNYHNSFIFLHAQTGFMGLITIALIIFSISTFYRINQVFLILLLALIMRAFTDMVIFFGRFDFIPFFFIFYFLKRLPFRDPRINPHCKYQRTIVHRGVN